MKDCPNPGANVMCLDCWGVIQARCKCKRIGRWCKCVKPNPYCEEKEVAKLLRALKLER